MPLALAGRLVRRAVNMSERDGIEQALFGYSEGHRQIAASVRLPPADLYVLSAATDLAAGASLTQDESYLTGLPLAESKRYALVRTWPAPELPRPGCVWSHVLLLDARGLSSFADLRDLLQYFKRPYGDFGTYGVPTPLRGATTESPSLDDSALLHLIDAYYSGKTAMLPTALDNNVAEAVVMAMWSQQWPRLRMAFAFRTARTTGGERRRSDLIQYDVQRGTLADTDLSKRYIPDWALIGAGDAAICEVTDLRRFLWRYGRDQSVTRSNYQMLVELYAFRSGRLNIPAQDAIRILRSLRDPSENSILKQDILGIPGASPSPLPPVSVVGLLDVLADEEVRQFVPSDAVVMRLRESDSTNVGEVARQFDQHYDELSPWSDELVEVIAKGADAATLQQDFPPRFLMPVLLARPDLVSQQSVAPLSNREFIELFAGYVETPAVDALASEAVRRDFGGPTNNMLVHQAPRPLFEATLDATERSDVGAVWTGIWGQYSELVFATGWPAGERSCHAFSRVSHLCDTRVTQVILLASGHPFSLRPRMICVARIGCFFLGTFFAQHWMSGLWARGSYVQLCFLTCDRRFSVGSCHTRST